jgi:hypothetical protein
MDIKVRNIEVSVETAELLAARGVQRTITA